MTIPKKFNWHKENGMKIMILSYKGKYKEIIDQYGIDVLKHELKRMEFIENYEACAGIKQAIEDYYK